MRLIPERLKPWHCAAVICLAGLAAYSNCLNNGLVSFDDSVLRPLEQVRPAEYGAKYAHWRWLGARALLLGLADRPLTKASLALDRFLFAQDLWMTHLLNVLLHLAASLLAFLVASRCLGSLAGGLTAGLLFCLHPVQTESVAYVAGRRDLLAGCLTLGSVLCWLRTDAGRRRFRQASAVLLWLGAMAAKPSAVTVPLLWAAYDFLHRREDWRRTGPWLFLLGAGVAGAFAASHLILEPSPATSPLSWVGGSPFAQLATEPRILALALWRLLFPWRLIGDYSYWAIEPSATPLDPSCLAAAILLAALAWLAWRSRRAERTVAFALSWLLLSYAPMLHLLPAGHNLQVFAEHWLYLPVFGAALLGARLFDLGRLRWPRTSIGAFLLIIILFGGRTVARNRIWKDDLTFWSTTMADVPRCARAQEALGMVLWSRGDHENGERLMREAIALLPDEPKPQVNLASFHLQKGEFDRGRALLRRAAALPFADLLNPSIQYNLGLALLYEGRGREAFERFKNARSVAGGWIFPARTRTAECLVLLGRLRAAEFIYRDVLASTPDDPLALGGLGLLLLQSTRPAEALPFLNRAASLQPGSPQARLDHGVALLELDRFAEALTVLQYVLRDHPFEPEAWRRYSMLNRRWGLPARASWAARRAVELDGSGASYEEYSAARELSLARRAAHRRKPR